MYLAATFVLIAAPGICSGIEPVLWRTGAIFLSMLIYGALLAGTEKRLSNETE